MRKYRHLLPTTPHLVVGELRPTEKLLSAIAKGIWILPEKFLVKLIFGVIEIGYSENY